MPKRLDLSGRVFGRLRAVAQGRTPSGRAGWDCDCECGRKTSVATSKLISGHTVSCGCYQREIANSKLSHGHNTGGISPTYVTWASMLARCADVTNSLYGGRGIAVCSRWNVFENFIADMGPRPMGKSIDRIDNLKGYEPSNCRWADRVVQSTNRSVTRWHYHEGRAQSIAAWSREFQLPYSGVYARIVRGMSMSEALTKPGLARLTPVRPRKGAADE